MEIRQLEYLVALAEHGQFTRAARAEHVAQPSLSQQIARLERELGIRLVERGPRGVTLTDAGARLTVRARRVLAELAAAREELGDLGELRAGRVTIGAMQTLGPIDLPRLLSIFHDRHPGVELAVREELSESLAELLRSDQLDLAFLSMTDRIERADELVRVPMASERLLAVLPRSHRLAQRATVRMSELAGESFVAFRTGASLRHSLNVAAAEAGFEPQIAFESNEIPRILAMVGRGLGISVLPEGDAASARAPVASVRVRHPALVRDVTLAWRQGRRLSPAADAFLDLVRGSHEGVATRG
jgi:DNA-binding transcriptional LysR family regulator